ncbi:hypothetical protein DRN98_08945 [Methanosarcinales archaeon]|uniref:Uncharacterized protein n=1 Tax=Candidatus Syntropharchaeum caldarium TaxID=1838285 RepID=A0A1F2PAM1_9EURY|nr:MAG: hypothetical protein SCAL_001116 [Candidatus Syntrophoarchaeum caldarius]RLG28931.1 MAG: hypothetical protein DRN98_08945 [Methanosarcinales archaeon]
MKTASIEKINAEIFQRFMDKCRKLNLNPEEAAEEAIEMWLEDLEYDEAFIERQKRILDEDEFVSIDEL